MYISINLGEKINKKRIVHLQWVLLYVELEEGTNEKFKNVYKLSTYLKYYMKCFNDQNLK